MCGEWEFGGLPARRVQGSIKSGVGGFLDFVGSSTRAHVQTSERTRIVGPPLILLNGSCQAWLFKNGSVPIRTDSSPYIDEALHYWDTQLMPANER